MAATKILVRWDLADPGKPKGTAVPHDGVARVGKIVFPERSYDARQLGADIWECNVVRDTQPDQPRKGALIVRPLRALTWDWIASGPELWGAREVRLECVEYPGLGEHDAPGRGGYYERFAELDRRNTPWRAAVEKQGLWTGSLWGHADKFFATFGEPADVRPATCPSRTGEGQTVLVYPHGEKIVETRSLAPAWPVTATGEIRQVERAIEAEFHVDLAPACRFWEGVGRLGGADAYSPPYTTTRYEALDAATQGRVLALLRASAIAPGDMARACWQTYVVDGYRGQGLDAAWIELAALHAPGGELRSERYRGQIHHAESDDGYRPAGSYDAWFLRDWLHVGGRIFMVADAPEREARRRLDIETERRRLIAERWDQIDEVVACRAPELTAHSAEILGATEVEWTAEYRATWKALVDEHRRAYAAQAAEIVRSAQLEAEWEAFRASAPRVEIPADAVELPPVVARDVGRQVAYGVTSIEELRPGHGASSRTAWYRDEAEAVAAREVAVVVATPVLERRVADHLRRQIREAWPGVSWERLALDARADVARSATASVIQLRASLAAIRAAAVSDTEAADFERVTIRLGAPARRQAAEGYWTRPWSVPGCDGVEVFLVENDRGWLPDNVAVRGAVGRVVLVERSQGHHGGHVTVTIDVAPSTVTPDVRAQVSEPIGPATMADLRAKFGGRR